MGWYGGMGKYYKYVQHSFKMFTHITTIELGTYANLLLYISLQTKVMVLKTQVTWKRLIHITSCFPFVLQKLYKSVPSIMLVTLNCINQRLCTYIYICFLNPPIMKSYIVYIEYSIYSTLLFFSAIVLLYISLQTKVMGKKTGKHR